MDLVQLFEMTLEDTIVFFSVFFGGSFVLSQIQKIANWLIISLIGRTGMILLACPGVVCHEIAHAFFCLLFGHKITKMRLFEVNLSSGSLGYVNHSYNPFSSYQQIGNFFIGMAPLICGSFMLFFLVEIFLTENMDSPFITSENYDLSVTVTLFDNITTNLDFFLITTQNIMIAIWDYWIINTWGGLVLAFFLVSIALHASPSRSDLQGARQGSVFIVVLYFFINACALYIYSCCDGGQLSEWMIYLKEGIVYSEIVMVNLICFVFALATIGLIMVSSCCLVMFLLIKSYIIFRGKNALPVQPATNE